MKKGIEYDLMPAPKDEQLVRLGTGWYPEERLAPPLPLKDRIYTFPTKEIIKDMILRGIISSSASKEFEQKLEDISRQDNG